MKQDNIIQSKSFQFSLKMIVLYKILTENKEYIISKQFLRSEKSIGENVEEAIAPQKKKDFISKNVNFLKRSKRNKILVETIERK